MPSHPAKPWKRRWLLEEVTISFIPSPVGKYYVTRGAFLVFSCRWQRACHMNSFWADSQRKLRGKHRCGSTRLEIYPCAKTRTPVDCMPLGVGPFQSNPNDEVTAIWWLWFPVVPFRGGCLTIHRMNQGATPANFQVAEGFLLPRKFDPSTPKPPQTNCWSCFGGSAIGLRYSLPPTNMEVQNGPLKEENRLSGVCALPC